MDLRNVKKGIVILLGMAVLSLNGCGGGGSSSGSDTGNNPQPPQSELVTITPENSVEVIDAVFSSFDITEGVGDLPVGNTVTSIGIQPMLKSTEMSVLNKVLKASKELNNLAQSDTMQCSQGGSISAEGDETSATLTFNNCMESGITMNGIIHITVNNTQTRIAMTYSNFSIEQDSNNKIVYTSVESISNISNGNTDIDTTMTINGYALVSGERTDFKNYQVVSSVNLNNYNVTLSVNGSIKSNCLGGWVDISTGSPIIADANNLCPTAGEITINGNGSSLTIIYNSDGSVDVSGSATDHYASCDDLSSGVCAN